MIRPYEVVEQYLTKVFPKQPSCSEIANALEREIKWVSMQLFVLKKTGVAQVKGRAQWAKWRLTGRNYEDKKTVKHNHDGSLSSYAILSAMQTVARDRLLNGTYHD